VGANIQASEIRGYISIFEVLYVFYNAVIGPLGFTAEFKWKDVTFKVKANANGADQLALAFCKTENIADFCLTLIQRFVADIDHPAESDILL
jgi:hypothetical protein